MNNDQQFDATPPPVSPGPGPDKVYSPRRFDQGRLNQVMLVGLVLGLLAQAAGHGWVAASKNICDSVTFICGLTGVIGTGLLAICEVVIASIVLKKMRVSNFIQIAVFATISLAALPVLGMYPTLEPSLTTAISALLSATIYGFYYWLFNGIKLDPTNKLIVSTVLVTVAIAGASTLSGLVENQNYEKVRQAKVESYNFELYRPSYVPQGYRMHSLEPSYDNDPAPYLDITYLYGNNDSGDPAPFHLYVFSYSNDRYNPPADCGSERPENHLTYDFPCILIGTTSTGEDIYHHDSSFSNHYNTYLKKETSIIVLATNTKQMSEAEKIRILDSLQPTTAAELFRLYEQDKE